MLKWPSGDVFKCSLYVSSTVLLTLETYPQPKEMHSQTPDVICVLLSGSVDEEVFQGADLELRFSCRKYAGAQGTWTLSVMSTGRWGSAATAEASARSHRSQSWKGPSIVQN